MWATPRRMSEAESVTMSEHTPPPMEINTPVRFRPCDRASLHTAATSSIDFVSSRAFSTSVETVFVFCNTARIAAP